MLPPPRDVHLAFHIAVVDRPAPVALDREVTAHPRHVDASRAVAADAHGAGHVVDLDLARAVVRDIHRPFHAAHFDATGRVADPNVTDVAHANVAGVVVNANPGRDTLDR